MLLDKLGTVISIEADNGIYIFDNMSGTGKTRLCNVLKDYMLIDDSIVAITYNDVKVFKSAVLDIIKPSKQKLLMLDRYDLYRPFAEDKIKEFGKTGIVLIDSKLEIGYFDDIVIVGLLPDRIEVTV
jgi:tRNA A37 threonylcarbamoyladenosine biosynthesis protein TsaE